MEDRKLNEAESLALIADMIRNSKRNLEKGNGNVFIIWGTTILLVSMIVGVTLYLSNNYLSFWLWMLIPLIGYSWTGIVKEKRQQVYTQIDKFVKHVWIVISLLAVLIPLVFLLLKVLQVDLILSSEGMPFRIIPFIELLICSIGITLTGIIINFRPSIIGGTIGLMISFLALIQIEWGVFICFGAWSFVSMIIPGILLNRYTKKIDTHV